MVGRSWATELHPEKVQSAETGIHSCRVDQSYRIIWKHIKPNDIVFCLVDKHEEAYRRAVRQTFTLQDGVVQVADILQVGAKPREQADSIFGWSRRDREGVGTLFVGYRNPQLLALGVPPDALSHVRALDNISTNWTWWKGSCARRGLFNRLAEIALGIVERTVVPDKELQRSLERHQGGDNLHRFVDGGLRQRALSGTLEEWILFSRRIRKQLITRTYNGPARIKGVAGSGKTVVAIHRARHLAREALKQDRKILFLTFGNRLPQVVHLPPGTPVWGGCARTGCHRMLHRAPVVLPVSRREARTASERSQPESPGNHLDQAVADAILRHPGLNLWSRPQSFFSDEIGYAIKGRAIASLQEYLRLERSGRGTPLREDERRAVSESTKAISSSCVPRGCGTLTTISWSRSDC